MSWGPHLFDVFLSYASLAVLLLPSATITHQLPVIGRGAFFAFVLSASGKLALTGSTAFHEGIAAAALVIPLWLRPRWGQALTLALLVRAILFGISSTALVLGPLFAGVFVSFLMQRNLFPRLRRALYAMAFFGTFAGLIPHAISRTFRYAPIINGDALTTIGIGLMTFAVVLFVIAEQQLCRRGGTADPFEPPSALMTSGLYAHIRNPIQVAECLFVLGAAVAMNEWLPMGYALGFAAVLLGPARLHEEKRLLGRFGDAYANYVSRVPAFFPAGRAGTARAKQRNKHQAR